MPALFRLFYDEFDGAYVCSPVTAPTHNLLTRRIDPEGHVVKLDYQDPPGGKAWLTAVTRGSGTPEAAKTTFAYHDNLAETWRYALRKSKTMPKGNAPGCDLLCAASYTTTYDYWAPADTYSFPGEPSLAAVPQQGWLKLSSRPGDIPVLCGGIPAVVVVKNVLFVERLGLRLLKVAKWARVATPLWLLTGASTITNLICR